MPPRKPVVAENIVTRYFTKWRVRVWFSNGEGVAVEFDADILDTVIGTVRTYHEIERDSGRQLTTTANHWARLIADELFKTTDRVAAIEVIDRSVAGASEQGVVHYYEWP